VSSLLALQARKLELPEAAVEAEEEGGSADGEEEEAPASPVKRDFTTSTKESKMVAGGYREDWIQFTWLAAGAAVFSALCMLFVYLGTPPSEEEAREANGSGST